MPISIESAKIANWVCPGLTTTVLLARLGITRYEKGRFDISALLVVLSILMLISRMILSVYFLEYGTPTDVDPTDAPYLSYEDVYHIKIGMKCTLAGRIAILTFYWLQTALLLLFYRKIVYEFRWAVMMIKACWVTLPVTYVMVFLSTFLECRPISQYWAVDPVNRCSRSYVQLFMQGITNIILDLFLLAISFPLMSLRIRRKGQTARIGILYGLGFFCIALTSLRMGYAYANKSYEPLRSFFASLQMLASAIVANAPTIYGSLILLIRRRNEEQGRQSRSASRPETWPISSITSRRGSAMAFMPTSMDSAGVARPALEETVSSMQVALMLHAYSAPSRVQSARPPAAPG